MSHAVRRLDDYLSHILDAINKIERYTTGMDERAFLTDELVQDAVIRNFEIIGEASHNLLQRYPEFAQEHTFMPLTSAYGMRNVLAHGYADVDASFVWVAVQRDLPELKRQVLALLP